MSAGRRAHLSAQLTEDLREDGGCHAAPGDGDGDEGRARPEAHGTQEEQHFNKLRHDSHPVQQVLLLLFVSTVLLGQLCILFAEHLQLFSTGLNSRMKTKNDFRYQAVMFNSMTFP